jgi:hypothetical protein
MTSQQAMMPTLLAPIALGDVDPAHRVVTEAPIWEARGPDALLADHAASGAVQGANRAAGLADRPVQRTDRAILLDDEVIGLD